MRLVVVGALALMACGSSSGAMKGEKFTSAPGDAEAWWGTLFVAGTTMTFDATFEYESVSPEDMESPNPKWQKSSDSAVVTCTVANVTTNGSFEFSDIDCGGFEPSILYPPLMGTWVTDGARLWHTSLTSSPEQRAELMASMTEWGMFRVPMKSAKLKSEEEEQTVSSLDGATWCSESLALMGDDYSTEVCLESGRGIVSVRASGGAAMSTVDSSYLRR